MQIEFLRPGLLPYPQARQLMEERKQQSVQQKKAWFIFTEHPAIYTTGIKTKPEHILDPAIDTFPIRRGGSVTVHSPGQLILYTVFPFRESGGLDLFIRRLEGAILDTLFDFGIPGRANDPESGVFTSRGKIAYVGIEASARVITHGVALNISNDLSLYKKIHSCGLTLPAARMQDFLTEPVSLEQMIPFLEKHVLSRFSGHSLNILKKISAHRFKEINPAFRIPVAFQYFNEGHYIMAHEMLEFTWREESIAETRKILQGFTQLASAFHKIYERPNLKGAVSLLQKAQPKLKDISFYIKNPESLHRSIEQVLTRLTIDGLVPGLYISLEGKNDEP